MCFRENISTFSLTHSCRVVCVPLHGNGAQLDDVSKAHPWGCRSCELLPAKRRAACVIATSF
jgi:hypothetical protein